MEKQIAEIYWMVPVFTFFLVLFISALYATLERRIKDAVKETLVNKGVAVSPPKMVSFYEGVYLMRQGKIKGLTEYEGAYSYIGLDNNDDTPALFTLRDTEKNPRPFRRVTEAEQKKKYYIIPLPETFNCPICGRHDIPLKDIMPPTP